jgi:hypothetical protein
MKQEIREWTEQKKKWMTTGLPSLPLYWY